METKGHQIGKKKKYIFFKQYFFWFTPIGDIYPVPTLFLKLLTQPLPMSGLLSISDQEMPGTGRVRDQCYGGSH